VLIRQYPGIRVVFGIVVDRAESRLDPAAFEDALAQGRRIKGFIAEILPSNQKMIRLARAAGDLIEQEDDEDGCKIKTTF